MKTVHEVFKESLSNIIKLIEKDNLKGCFLASKNLTLYSTMSDYDDGILICELLESVFSQVGPLFEAFQIEENDKKQVLDEMKTHLSQILKNYGVEDKNQLYLGLKEIRATATKFQIRILESAKSKGKVKVQISE